MIDNTSLATSSVVSKLVQKGFAFLSCLVCHSFRHSSRQPQRGTQDTSITWHFVVQLFVVGWRGSEGGGGQGGQGGGGGQGRGGGSFVEIRTKNGLDIWVGDKVRRKELTESQERSGCSRQRTFRAARRVTCVTTQHDGAARKKYRTWKERGEERGRRGEGGMERCQW